MRNFLDPFYHEGVEAALAINGSPESVPLTEFIYPMDLSDNILERMKELNPDVRFKIE